MEIDYQFQQAGTPAGGAMRYNVYLERRPSPVCRSAPRRPVPAEARRGIHHYRERINLTAGTFSQQSSEKEQTNLLAGVGLGYDFPNGLSIIGEYEYYGQVGNGFNYSASGMSGTGRADMNLFSVSGMIRF
jgi:hypothetical protein